MQLPPVSFQNFSSPHMEASAHGAVTAHPDPLQIPPICLRPRKQLPGILVQAGEGTWRPAGSWEPAAASKQRGEGVECQGEGTALRSSPSPSAPPRGRPAAPVGHLGGGVLAAPAQTWHSLQKVAWPHPHWGRQWGPRGHTNDWPGFPGDRASQDWLGSFLTAR